MLVKLLSKNRITLPNRFTDSFAPFEYLEIEVIEGKIVLTPLRLHRADAVREKLIGLGVDEHSVADAVTWARRLGIAGPALG